MITIVTSSRRQAEENSLMPDKGESYEVFPFPSHIQNETLLKNLREDKIWPHRSTENLEKKVEHFFSDLITWI